MQEAQLYITRVLETGSGFGARTDDGSHAFIPAKLVMASKIVEGDIVEVKLIPNAHQNNRGNAAPWLAVYAAKPADESSPVSAPVETIDDRALGVLQDIGYGTTAEIANDLGVDTVIASNALSRLFKTGRAAKAEVYARPDQDRASFCMWAKDVAHFLPEVGE
jgi:translation initiation factor IF-1